MGRILKWAKQLSLLAATTIGGVAGLIYRPSWWVVSLVSLLAWLVIQAVLKVVPWQPRELPEEPPDMRYVRHRDRD